MEAHHREVKNNRPLKQQPSPRPTSFKIANTHLNQINQLMAAKLVKMKRN